jgi:hypothetical protein
MWVHLQAVGQINRTNLMESDRGWQYFWIQVVPIKTWATKSAYSIAQSFCAYACLGEIPLLPTWKLLGPVCESFESSPGMRGFRGRTHRPVDRDRRYCKWVRAMLWRKVSKRPRPNPAQKWQIIISHKFLARSLALGCVKSQKYLYKLFVCILVICTTRKLLPL